PMLQREFRRSGAEAVVIRGTVAANRVDELAARSDVIRVWPDGPILQLPIGKSEQRAPCPIPPCDCSASTLAQGTLGEVARYLGGDQIWASGHRGAGVVIGLVDCGICALGRAVVPGETALIPNVVGGFPEDSWGTTSRKSTLWFDHGNMVAVDVL